jgi:acetylglutamate kinase
VSGAGGSAGAATNGNEASLRLVIKLGGEVVKSRELSAIAADVASLRALGHRVFLVHGGGPQATELSGRLGMTPSIVGGRRITDEATLEVMKMTVAGQVNVDLCAALVRAGTRPIGMHGASGPVIRAVKRPPRVVSGAGPDPVDFGHVGDVTGVDAALLSMLADAGLVPVVACLGCGDDGALYNINADIVANKVAIALRASGLLLVTDVPGVLRDIADPGSRLARLTVAQARAAIADGTITRGMIPKLEESFAAIAQGVAAVHIVGKLQQGDLVRAATEPGSFGTVLSA